MLVFESRLQPNIPRWHIALKVLDVTNKDFEDCHRILLFIVIERKLDKCL